MKIHGKLHQLYDALQRRFNLPQYLTLHVVIGLVISALCLWAFMELADEVIRENEFVNIDALITQTVHRNATPLATTVFLAITRLGYEVLTVIGVVGAVALGYRRRLYMLGVWVMAFVGGQILNTLLKAYFARPRPIVETPIIEALYYSFPSGHAMMSVIVYGLLAYLVTRNIQRRARRHLIYVSAALLVLLIGLSRIYLGVHYFTDILAGFAAGGLWLMVSISALEVISARRRRQVGHPERVSA